MQRARKLDTPPHRAMPALHGEPLKDEPRWPWRVRILFMIAAGAVCWAVPILIVYLLVF